MCRWCSWLFVVVVSCLLLCEVVCFVLVSLLLCVTFSRWCMLLGVGVVFWFCWLRLSLPVACCVYCGCVLLRIVCVVC